MNTTTETPKVIKSNDLRYSISKTVGKEWIKVNIRLNDECKNGHQDFAITADIYEAGKPHTDRYFISGGCCHDEIAKHFPEFIPFIKLHLCDYKGIPMHAGANGFYHMREGFNSKSTGEAFKAEYCEYYRITPDQFEKLKTAENQLQFSIMLQNIGILTQWEVEANKAIKQLEELTGKEFLIDSKRTQFVAPTAAEIEEENKKQASGYYNDEAKAEREQAKINELIAKLEAARDKEINKHLEEFEVKKAVLLAGGSKALKNCIYYNHTRTLAFNWMRFDKLSEEVIETILSKIVLPEGVKTQIKG